MTEDVRERTVIIALKRKALAAYWTSIRRAHFNAHGVEPPMSRLILHLLSEPLDWRTENCPDAFVDVSDAYEQLIASVIKDPPDSVGVRVPIIFANSADAVLFKLTWSHAYDLESPCA